MLSLDGGRERPMGVATHPAPSAFPTPCNPFRLVYRRPYLKEPILLRPISIGQLWKAARRRSPDRPPTSMVMVLAERCSETRTRPHPGVQAVVPARRRVRKRCGHTARMSTPTFRWTRTRHLRPLERLLPTEKFRFVWQTAEATATRFPSHWERLWWLFTAYFRLRFH